MSSCYQDSLNHNIKEAVLKAYVELIKYKFSVLRKEQDRRQRIDLESEIYELIETIKDINKKE